MVSNMRVGVLNHWKIITRLRCAAEMLSWVRRFGILRLFPFSFYINIFRQPTIPMNKKITVYEINHGDGWTDFPRNISFLVCGNYVH